MGIGDTENYENTQLINLAQKVSAFSFGSKTIGNKSFLKGELGNGIFADHEQGHYYQSLIVGPGYLFGIALPSLIHYMLFDSENYYDYYNFYTEAWANELAGISLPVQTQTAADNFYIPPNCDLYVDGRPVNGGPP